MKLDELISIVSERTGLDIVAKTRKEEYTLARAIYYQIALEFGIGTVTQVSKSIGRNHATVLYSIQNTFPQLEKYFPKYHKIYVALNREFGSSKYLFKTYEEKYYLLLDEYNLLKKQIEVFNTPGVERMDMIKTLSKVPEEKLSKLKIRFDAVVKML